MNTRKKILRTAIGLFTVALLVVIGFTLVLQVIPTWGATPEEAARILPGDEIVADPLVKWTHSITINAPAEEVWGWVSQIGERRGGFYSYTFIENRMGNGDVYHNADRIVPEWQNPEPGTVMIQGAMAVKALEPGKWYLGASTNEMGWSWLWFLEPLNENQTRLIVRSHIKPAGAMSDNTVGTVLNLGGFVMEQAMLQGLKARAEGATPLPFYEPLEIVLWLIPLGAGMVAAVYFVTSRNWLLPGITGVLSVIALFVFTFIQPSVAFRILADLTLLIVLAGVVLARNGERSAPRHSRDRADQGILQSGEVR